MKLELEFLKRLSDSELQELETLLSFEFDKQSKIYDNEFDNKYFINNDDCNESYNYACVIVREAEQNLKMVRRHQRYRIRLNKKKEAQWDIG